MKATPRRLSRWRSPRHAGISVAGAVLDGVADGVAEIQDRPQATLGLILADDLGLDSQHRATTAARIFGSRFRSLGTHAPAAGTARRRK